MLSENNDGTYRAGPADIICIIRLPIGTFHVVLFEEQPIPGQILQINQPKVIRLKSKIYSTEGSTTIKGAQAHSEEFRKIFLLPDQNVVIDKAVDVEGSILNWTLQNWTTGNISLKEALFPQ